MNVGIILVGSELLNGDIVDTNSQFIQKLLLEYGIAVIEKIVVKDDILSISKALKNMYDDVDKIIVSGGLGPTFDDITREAIAKFLNVGLKVDTQGLKQIANFFETHNMVMTENNIKQVNLPIGCTIIENHVGVAPGFHIDKIIALQGVPRELKAGLTLYMSKYFEKTDSKCLWDILLYGTAESIVEDKIIDIIKRYEHEFEFEILARPYGIIIRIIYDKKQESAVDTVKKALIFRLDTHYYGFNSDRLETVLVNKIRDRQYSVSVAESCTGGVVSSAITSVSGCSEVFLEGLVTYSNQSKQQRLSVAPKTLEMHGAVSEETAYEMLAGLRSDVKIVTTGIAGPTGGSVEKPVGLVYIGIEIQGKKWVHRCMFSGDRELIQNKAAKQALFLTIKYLEGHNDKTVEKY